MLKSMKLVGNIGVKISCIFPLHYNVGNSILLTVVLRAEKIPSKSKCDICPPCANFN